MASWQKVVNDVYKKYSNLRATGFQKDCNLQKLKTEIKQCQANLEAAVREKLMYASRMKELERQKRNIQDDYDHLYTVTKKVMEPRRCVYYDTYTPTYCYETATQSITDPVVRDFFTYFK